METFKIGEVVEFGRTHGEKTKGEVVKVNAKTLKVRQLESRGTFATKPVGTLWLVSRAFCRKLGAEGTVPASGRTEAEILVEIRKIYAGLSPENLSCDGELPLAAVRKRGAALRARLQACFTELGREVTEDQAYALVWCFR